MRCALKNCNNNNKKKPCTLSFFSFPSDPTLLKQWKRFCGRGNSMNVKTSQICMEHFKPEDFENNLQFEMGFTKRRFLKRGAVPTVRKVLGKDEERHMCRVQRIQKRENKKIVEMLIKEHDAELVSHNDVNEQLLQPVKTEYSTEGQFHPDSEFLLECQKDEVLLKRQKDEKNEMKNLKTEMKYLKKEMKRLRKENSALKETVKKQASKPRYIYILGMLDATTNVQ